MTEHDAHDEQELIDFLLGQSEDPAATRRRLQTDPAFRTLQDDIKNAFAALNLLPEAAAPADLAARTMQRIAQHQQVNVLLARQEINRRTWWRPTFSLRDLIAAAAAIILVAVSLVPSLQQAGQQARIDLCAAQMGQIGTALGAYANDNRGHLPVVMADSSSWLATDNGPASSNSAGLFKLVPGQYAPATVFHCPGLGGGTDAFVVQSGMTDFPGRQYISYSYQHALGAAALSRSRPDLMAVASEMAILADNTPLFGGGQFIPGRMKLLVSDNHARSGQNVLYLDMHVGWSPVPEAGVAGDNIYLVRGIYSYRGDEAPADVTDSFLLPAYTGGN